MHPHQLFLASRGWIGARLYASIEELEAATGGEDEGELVVDRIHYRVVLRRSERDARFDSRFPESRMEHRTARVGFVGAGPLQAMQIPQPLVAHSAEHMWSD